MPTLIPKAPRCFRTRLVAKKASRFSYCQDLSSSQPAPDDEQFETDTFTQREDGEEALPLGNVIAYATEYRRRDAPPTCWRLAGHLNQEIAVLHWNCGHVPPLCKRAGWHLACRVGDSSIGRRTVEKRNERRLLRATRA